MKQAVILQHLRREGPGMIVELCRERGLQPDVRRLDLGAPVPDTLAPGDLLVIMGGPMGVADVGDPRFAYLDREVELARRLLARQQPMLGVCLGSQLLAHAAGSRVYPNLRPDRNGVLQPAREVGFGQVRLLGTEHEPALAGLPAQLDVLHWHGDTFELPANGVRLAESDLCANQAFRLGKRVFGLQFHIEVDAALTRLWAAEDAAFVVSARGPDGPATIAAMSDEACRAMAGPGKRLLENLFAEMLAD
jgi:GMP synthase-like glutamine amidotransferase